MCLGKKNQCNEIIKVILLSTLFFIWTNQANAGCSNSPTRGAAIDCVEKKIEDLPKKKDCRNISIGAGTDSSASCPEGTVMMGLRQTYHGGAWRNYVLELECCEIQ